ncbi:MAG: acyltransferase [Bacteroidales bacterium]|nr:acyltransferase [Bacteroidales bacterium]
MGISTRQSNIELLRIISMIMILMVHFTGATFPIPNQITINNFFNINTSTKVIMESFSIIGVNCFILISGYFGIRPSVKGIVNFILWCSFYSISIYSLYTLARPNQYNVQNIIESFAIFSHTDLWFIPAYFSLYIIAPIINKGTSSLNQKQFILLLCGLTFINVYLGWFWGEKVNPTGYNVMQLIYIYIIGRYIKTKAKSIYRIKCNRYIIGYLISLLLIVFSTFICKSSAAFAYNSPFVILSSVFFFLIFASMYFHNTTINYIASSAFAVYLIHKMPPVWNDLKNILIDNTNGTNPFIFAIFWILFVALIFTSSITIDKIRELITNPVSAKITKLIKRII